MPPLLARRKREYVCVSRKSIIIIKGFHEGDNVKVKGGCRFLIRDCGTWRRRRHGARAEGAELQRSTNGGGGGLIVFMQRYVTTIHQAKRSGREVCLSVQPVSSLTDRDAQQVGE